MLTVRETSTSGLIYDQDKNPDFDQGDKTFVQLLRDVVTDYEAKEEERLRNVEQSARPRQEGRDHKEQAFPEEERVPQLQACDEETTNELTCSAPQVKKLTQRQ